MSGDYSKELLRNGIIEAKSGDKNTARRYLDRAIYMASSHEVMAEAWFWMSEVSDDAAEKRKALENCLAHDMRHARARRALAILNGDIKADELVNPDQIPVAPEGLRDADAKRFMCPKCGGHMTFAPDGQSLVCDYCARDHSLDTGAVQKEKDFIVAMATMKGHGKPLQEQVFQCSGCGAEVILPPDQISANCIYCDSPYVVSLEKAKDLLAPDAILPHGFDQKHAVKLLIQWVKQNKIEPEIQVNIPRGLYLPLWTFDIGGEVEYTYEMIENQNEAYSKNEYPKVMRITDQYPVLMDDLPLPASRKLSAVFLKLIPSFELTSLKAYDPRFLVSWPAEIYDVPMADASLDARSQAYNKYKNDLPHLLNNIRIIHTSSANLTVESFKLNLLPVWMTEIPFGGREHLVLINGQSGVVASDMPGKEDATESGGLFNFLKDILES